ncbi:MAG: glgA [Chthoniobacter sp.]|nr:glgA [Chthoniobacter sp.]
MKILLAGSELTPFARTGGLGDVLDALPAALAARGHEVSLVVPCYSAFLEAPELKPQPTGVRISIEVGHHRRIAEILECTAEYGVQLFLVRCDELFARSGLYGSEGRDFEDNAERFIFFSKAVVELARRLRPAPDIAHVHDWQTALVPVLVAAQRLPFRSVLTIHNLAYQGSFWAPDFGLTNLPGSYFSARGVEFYGRMNLLKAGILYASQVTTVSARYAQEIQTPAFGAGLDAVIREHAEKLHGILNGADYRVWNPETDKLLPKKFGPSAMSGKTTSRTALLKSLGLAPKPSGPIFALVTRLAQQKGIDLLVPLLDRLLANDVRLVVLGEGQTSYERELGIASRRHPERFAYRRSMDEKLAHLIYAGADVFLIPSHFEPCGLSAMYALKYGAVPLAHATGGLYEMIQDYDSASDTGNGVLFHDDSPEALWDAMVRVLGYYGAPEQWAKLLQRGMACDFSWSRSVERYEEVYELAVK